MHLVFISFMHLIITILCLLKQFLDDSISSSSYILIQFFLKLVVKAYCIYNRVQNIVGQKIQIDIKSFILGQSKRRFSNIWVKFETLTFTSFLEC